MDTPLPRLVLVHGSLSSIAAWGDYGDLLPHQEVVTVDLPGHGENREQEFTTDSALQAIGAAVGGTAAPVVLGGHSLGGYLSALWAHRNPGRLAGLVLMGASGKPNSRLAGLYKAFSRLTERADHDRLARRREALAQRLGVRPEQMSGQASYELLPLTWQAVFDDCPPWMVTTLDVPVLYVNGQFDQMRIHERQYVARTPDARLRIIKGATHFAPLTHEPEVAGAIAEFVAEVTSGGAKLQ